VVAFVGYLSTAIGGVMVLATAVVGVMALLDTLRTPGPGQGKEQAALDEFRRLDRDGGGTLSKQEVADALRARGLPCSREDVERFFKRVDLNGDGTIDEAEFRRFAIQRVEEDGSLEAIAAPPRRLGSIGGPMGGRLGSIGGPMGGRLGSTGGGMTGSSGSQ
jgi:hypothetical protein